MAGEDGAIRRNLREFGDLTEFSVQALGDMPRALRYVSEILRQAAIIVRGTTVFVFIMGFFIGVVETIVGYYFLRSAGAADYTPLIAGVAAARVSGAFMFGYIFSAKVGCGLVAEIGAMSISEELDAYEVEGVGAGIYVVATRVLGALLFVPIATAVAVLGNIAGSYIEAVVILRANSNAVFSEFVWSNFGVPDLLFAFVLIGVLALSIALVGCYYGFRTKGGPDQVGAAAARSLVINLVLVHVICGTAFYAVYGANLGLPIGG
jgi:phospholipid/cholesterol/gamma-HCH transport system permease protein